MKRFGSTYKFYSSENFYDNVVIASLISLNINSVPVEFIVVYNILSFDDIMKC